MNDRELLEKLNKVGKGFCAAKWYNSTIWLGNGRTSSCHHPPAHSINLDDVVKNPSALHNTEYKKSVRKEMLNGERPAECGYCWKVEDAAPNAVSDRVYKSNIYTPNDISKLAKQSPDIDVNPKTLEISFDNVCDYQCTYCNAEFSTTWNADINRNGGYDLSTDGGATYNQPYEFDTNIVKNPTVYTDAFQRWYDSGLKDDLTELRITGGEPTMSPSFWRFINNIDNANYQFSVNTNLGMRTDVMDKLIAASYKFKGFDLYTSIESSPSIAEFVRTGFKWDTWTSNLDHFIREGKYTSINIMMTISCLSLPGLVGFLEEYKSLKKYYPNVHMTISANILRFPSFQSITVLSNELKKHYHSALTEWLNTNDNVLADFEIQHLNRLLDYLHNVDTSYEDTDTLKSKHSDLHKFVTQYADRRGVDIHSIYHKEFVNWFNKLKK